MVVPNVHKGIQFQPLRMNSDALGALAADTVLSLNTALSSGLTQSFLIKKIDLRLTIGNFGESDSIIVGCAVGTASVAEIASGIRDVTLDPDEPGEMGEPGLSNIIYWETLRLFTGTRPDSSAVNGHGNVVNESVSIGGGKGLPMKKSHGIQVFAYNPQAAAILTGASVRGLVIIKGVWLND